jgi:hypothetical protein
VRDFYKEEEGRTKKKKEREGKKRCELVFSKETISYPIDTIDESRIHL